MWQSPTKYAKTYVIHSFEMAIVRPNREPHKKQPTKIYPFLNIHLKHIIHYLNIISFHSIARTHTKGKQSQLDQNRYNQILIFDAGITHTQ